MNIINIIYIVLAFIIAAYSTFQQSEPALFWIDLFAPEAGDTYSVKIVFLLTVLTLLLPLMVVMSISFLFSRIKDAAQTKNIDPSETGIWLSRKKQFQSFMMPIPVFINDIEVGKINSGSTKFFKTPIGSTQLKVGKGKAESEKLDFNLTFGKQVKTELEVIPSGLKVLFILKEV